VAIVMLCYIVLVALIGVTTIVMLIADKGLAEAEHPAHFFKEFVQIWLIETAWRNFKLTS
jgi:hypothetical protein